MAYEVEYAGNYLHDYFKVLSIERTLLPPRENFTREIPSVHGKIYTGFKYNPKQYVLKCALSADDNVDFNDRIKDIAFILDTKEPSKLILGDDPHCYNYAVVDGEIDIERMRYTGTFDITFICYDPISYSIEEDEFIANEKKILTIDNAGTFSSYPKINIAFNKEANFLQCTNYDTRTILVGQPPSVTSTVTTFNDKVLRDSCTTLEGWNAIANVIDAGREVNGNLIINKGGWGICLGSAGSSDTNWHGGGLRKNLGQDLQDFKVEVKMSHNSLGDVNGVGGGSNGSGSSTTSTKYQITADPSLRIRSGRGTKYKQVGTIKKGTIVSVTDIKEKWGKVTHNSVTGYIYMQYTKKYTEPTTSNTSAKYKVTPKQGLNLRSGRGTKYSRLKVIPYNTQITISDVKSNWGKTTYGGKTGYVSMQYVSKVTTSKSINMLADEETPSTENKIGMVEVYGYDKNGVKLFKFQLIDNQKYYEYTEPAVEFGSKLVLDDGKNCPAPKTTTKTENDKKVTYTIDSGRYGDWNEFEGWFTLQRKTVNGKQQWFAKIEKIGSDGKVKKMIQTQTLVGNYPTGELNNIVIFIGGYQKEELVDYMNIHEVYVTNLADPPKPEVIKPIFKQGDELLIDSTTQKVYLNGRLFMTELDIGSQFFDCPVGSSQFICKSDDETIDVSATIQKRWL